MKWNIKLYEENKKTKTKWNQSKFKVHQEQLLKNKMNDDVKAIHIYLPKMFKDIHNNNNDNIKSDKEQMSNQVII